MVLKVGLRNPLGGSQPQVGGVTRGWDSPSWNLDMHRIVPLVHGVMMNAYMGHLYFPEYKIE